MQEKSVSTWKHARQMEKIDCLNRERLLCSLLKTNETPRLLCGTPEVLYPCFAKILLANRDTDFCRWALYCVSTWKRLCRNGLKESARCRGVSSGVLVQKNRFRRRPVSTWKQDLKGRMWF